MEQTARDHKRRIYSLNFPADLDPEVVTEFFRSLSGILRPEVSGISQLLGLDKYEQAFRSCPSIVVETWGGTAEGIRWLLKVPFSYEEQVRMRLEALIPGVQITREKEHPVRVWVHAEELKLKSGHRSMHISDPKYLSVVMRSAFGRMGEGESLALQIVITPKSTEHPVEHGSTSSRENTLWSFFTGQTEASRDEVSDRNAKIQEPNVLCSLRVGAVASTPVRASAIVSNIVGALNSTRGASNYFVKLPMGSRKIARRMNEATTSMNLPVQLSAPELSAMIGWPLGDVIVPGQPTPASRRLPAPASVGVNDIILGNSNYSGRERPVALGFKQMVLHQHVIGPPGKGKTALLANEIRQIIKAGYGAIVIEQKGDLLNAVLDYIPESRMNDVIVLDLNDTRYPVAFNLLEQGDKSIITSELISVFKQWYSDHPSLWAPKVMHYGMHTLAETKGSTFLDLLPLFAPTGDEVDWAHSVRSAVREPQTRRFWQEFENMSKREQDALVGPLNSRFWPITQSRLQNVLGQSKSTFFMNDVIRENKILLVNLAGIEPDAATLMGTLIVNSVRQAAWAYPAPDRPNMLFMDEAHHFMNLPTDLQLMLVEARSKGLGIAFAHQGMWQLPPAMKQAINIATQTKVAFQTSGDDTREVAKILGDPITDKDISNLPQFDTVARIATPTGMSAPLTMSTLPPAKGYGLSQQIIYASRGRYGVPIEKVMDENMARRSSDNVPRRARPKPDLDGSGALG